ncbi:MAG: hypothetical protein GX939_02805 [Clostridiaceae bacterium]|nr:hypothetical protein [Clostridiaceae bacterium]
MRIQYCLYNLSDSERSIANIESLEEVVLTNLSDPLGFEHFDLNIIDLSSSGIWVSSQHQVGMIDSGNDLKSIGEMIKNSAYCLVLVIAPMNINYGFSPEGKRTSQAGGTCKYTSNIALKDVRYILDKQISTVTDSVTALEYAAFEHNDIDDTATSAFYIAKSGAPWVSVYNAKDSDKTVFARRGDTRIYLTTINNLSCDGLVKLLEMASEIKKPSDEEPVWMEGVIMFDDNKQNEIISIQQGVIEDAQKLINEAQKKLDENKWYKSALYKADEDLVEVVTDILEILFEEDMNDFVDRRKEDQRLIIDGKTYLFEIKGTSSNVRRDNLSQLENHKQIYIVNEEVDATTVKGILVINPLRKKKLAEREPVHFNEISLAERYDLLIITTETLLKLLEMKFSGAISKEEVIAMMDKSGLLSI